MKNDIIISFCIPIFNQKQLVKKCVNKIISNDDKRIEVVLCDDHSDENIEDLLNEWNDERIKFYRNDKNLGHDLNIITCLKKAKGKFAFLLRTRDFIIPTSITDIIDEVEKNSNISYLTGVAVNQRQELKINYIYKTYKKGWEALKMHTKLYVHPSGSLYNLEMLNLDELESFVIKNVDNKFSFIVHDLVRIELSQKGDFVTLDKPIWIYTDTEKEKDVAQNSAKNKESVYNFKYGYQRYLYEIKWIDYLFKKHLFDKQYKEYMYTYLSVFYYKQCTWIFKKRNNNKNLQEHYNYESIKFSALKETNRFIKYMDKIIGNSIEYGVIKKIKIKIFITAIWEMNRYYVGGVLKKLGLDSIYFKWRNKHSVKN